MRGNDRTAAARGETVAARKMNRRCRSSLRFAAGSVIEQLEVRRMLCDIDVNGVLHGTADNVNLEPYIAPTSQLYKLLHGPQVLLPDTPATAPAPPPRNSQFTRASSSSTDFGPTQSIQALSSGPSLVQASTPINQPSG